MWQTAVYTNINGDRHSELHIENSKNQKGDITQQHIDIWRCLLGNITFLIFAVFDV